MLLKSESVSHVEGDHSKSANGCAGYWRGVVVVVARVVGHPGLMGLDDNEGILGGADVASVKLQKTEVMVQIVSSTFSIRILTML